jgi:hypothetical protein
VGIVELLLKTMDRNENCKILNNRSNASMVFEVHDCLYPNACNASP